MQTDCRLDLFATRSSLSLVSSACSLTQLLLPRCLRVLRQAELRLHHFLINYVQLLAPPLPAPREVGLTFQVSVSPLQEKSTLSCSSYISLLSLFLRAH